MRFLRVGLFVLATTQAALSAPVFRRGASNGTLEVVYLHPIEQNLKAPGYPRARSTPRRRNPTPLLASRATCRCHPCRTGRLLRSRTCHPCRRGRLLRSRTCHPCRRGRLLRSRTCHPCRRGRLLRFRARISMGAHTAHEAQQLRTPPPTPVNQLPVNQHRLPLTPPHTPAKTTFETAHENPEGDT
ncbi:hypothetical protein K439DRAFT_320430 [Ramaria rubella]|nr:hypothetical protein K439DRAFT_320430 [Ramaria rubella]